MHNSEYMSKRHRPKCIFSPPLPTSSEQGVASDVNRTRSNSIVPLKSGNYRPPALPPTPAETHVTRAVDGPIARARNIALLDPRVAVTVRGRTMSNHRYRHHYSDSCRAQSCWTQTLPLPPRLGALVTRRTVPVVGAYDSPPPYTSHSSAVAVVVVVVVGMTRRG